MSSITVIPILPPRRPRAARRILRAMATEPSPAHKPAGSRQYIAAARRSYKIAEITGLDRQRVTRLLHRAGVPLRARGAGRLRPTRRADDPPSLALLIADLYENGKLSSRQIAAITGMPERTVRDRLHRYGVRTRTKGGRNREDRRMVPAAVLRDLYTRLGMTAAEVGRRLGTSRDTVLGSAHALGVPVRTGGAVPLPGPEEIELIGALYADPLIAAVLDAHDIPRVPPGGPLWERFPAPVPLNIPLVKDLYWSCGADLNHIEALTGQPAATVRGFMRRAGIPLRHPGGRSPFARRWRTSDGERSGTSRGKAVARTDDGPHRHPRAGHRARPRAKQAKAPGSADCS